MIEKLKEINEKIINSGIESEENLKKQLLIQKLLNDKECFLKMNVQPAFSLLSDLKIPNEDLKKVYSELIDVKNYVD